MCDFETACINWETHIKEFVNLVSDGSIVALTNTQWIYKKKRINVYPAGSNGKKKRGASGLAYRSSVDLNKIAANAVWGVFKDFAKKYNLDTIERLSNNEKDLGRYRFNATNNNTSDTLSCLIDLPNEWNKARISISIFIGARYRKEDL